MTSPATIYWWKTGERLLADALDQITDDELDGPSLLPGWTRRTIVAHVARNADALANLLDWARTGNENPMYASPEARDQGIAETARLAPSALRADYQAAKQRLAAAILQQPEDAWANTVRTAQGRTVPASEIPWMRCREVWIHAVDLDTDTDFSAIPTDVLLAIIDDVTQIWQRRNQTPGLSLSAAGHHWGTGAITVTGELPHLAAWLTGRGNADPLNTDGPLVDPPPWL